MSRVDLEPPDRIPVPLVFGAVLQEDTSDVPARVREARERWLAAVVATEPKPSRAALTVPSVRIPGWITTLFGLATIAMGTVWLSLSEPDPTERAVYVPPVDRTRQAVLAYANAASAEALAEAGVYRKGIRAIEAGRPFATFRALDATPGVGPKTLEALRRGAERAPGG